MFVEIVFNLRCMTLSLSYLANAFASVLYKIYFCKLKLFLKNCEYVSSNFIRSGHCFESSVLWYSMILEHVDYSLF